MFYLSLSTHYSLLILSCIICCNPFNKIDNTANIQQDKFKIDFELKSDSIWQAPEVGELTDIFLVLEMMNLGNKPVRLPIMDKFQVSMQHPNGNELMMEGGQDVVIPGKPISDPILPGEKYILELPAYLQQGADHQLKLSIKDKLGSIWWIMPLEAGSYLLKMQYMNRTVDNNNNPDLWSGEANINTVTVQIIY